MNPFKKESHRKERIESVIAQEVGRIILQELSDPRCGLCSVTKVTISSDLKNAKVYVSVLGEEAKQRTTLRALQHAHKFIHRRLFQELNLRHTPALSFHIDRTTERSIRISQILREARPVEPAENPPDPDESG